MVLGDPNREVKLSAFLSWKVLFILSVIFYLLGDGILWETMFVITFLMATIDLIRQIIKKHKK